MKLKFRHSPRILLGFAALCPGTLPLAASTLDLTTAGATASVAAIIGGTYRVDQINPQSTGTGVIDSFLRIQGNGNEMGFNTDATPTLDAKAGTFTHSLHLSDVPIVSLSGTAYR